MKQRGSRATLMNCGIEVVVEYKAYRGWPGSREEPPEPPSVEIWGIWISGQEMSEELLSQYFMDELQQNIEEYVQESGYFEE